MQKFKGKITEVLQREVEIKAECKEDAMEILSEMYRSEEVVLDYNDLKKTDFKVTEKVKNRSNYER